MHVNQMLSAAITVRPSGCSYTSPTSKSSKTRPVQPLFVTMNASTMHSRRQLADDFRRLGVDAGDSIMLHASVRAVGPIAGGPDQIHLALKDVLTERGTLMMYA